MIFRLEQRACRSPDRERPHNSRHQARGAPPGSSLGLLQAAFMLDEDGVRQIMENRDKTA
ncbi:hypothetical protein ORIO_20325 (plasmid) [Cereibacter azotoformans]|uniref:hypothetical protein n=1 Tax=Cereibacter azotoformans TaxID=43057 RepID=UPI001EEBCF71|nr:hypothetical protein [Cereibacter azotoformans]ULB12153.1 hypothetical protein ORIO_20325 [Cereibacter azotoformans]